MIIQLFVYGIAFLNLSMTVSLVWMYVAMQIEKTHIQHQQTLMLVEQQEEMNNIRIKMVLSQIQPHFLYNTLNSIYYLCEKAPEKAQKAISQFSDYLRANLDSLKLTEPVPFEMEMRHVKNYLSLEKMRFDEELEIQYDITVSTFSLPALSLQPIVENAVKYGVGKKKGGGTVSIRTWEEEKFFIIQVLDDGVGFDIMEKKEDGRTHIGIENVRQRLKMMSGGELEIKTKRGVGTDAKIRIPK